MSNNTKLIILQKQNIKKKTVTRIDEKLEKRLKLIESNEINNLKKPKKGQIYVHLENDNEYQFFRFNGKEWLEIK